MRRISFKGVLLGGIAGVFATNIFLIPVMVYVTSQFDVMHMSQPQLQAAVMNSIQKSFAIHMIQVAVGLACSVLGGYVGALLAKHDEVLNAALTSFLSIGIAIYSLANGTGPGTMKERSLVIVASPLVAALGGYIRLAQKRRTVSVAEDQAL